MQTYLFSRWIPASILVLLVGGLATGQEFVRLREKFAPGYQYHVSTRVELTGNLALPGEKNQVKPESLGLTGNSAIEYDERILEPGSDGQVEKTIRIYRRIDFQRKVGDKPQESTIRPSVRRLVLLRLKNSEVPFSPDGPLTWAEIDLVRTDVFTPALVGLLPEGAVHVGEHWTATTAAVQELTDMERIEEGKIECQLEQLTTLNRRRHARVAFRGAVRGLNEDGPNRQELDGYCYFDLESEHVSYVSLKGTSFLLDKEGKTLGTVEGRFVLTRQAHRRSPDLTDEALHGLSLEPSPENTQLLYENQELGVRFLHPRRWRVAGVHGQQIALDEANGSGLLLTVEPLERVPTGEQFLAESRDFLQKQKVKVLSVDPTRRVADAHQSLERFAFSIETNGQRAFMDYYVIRQQAAGGTIAARLLPGDYTALQKDVERIARSAVVTSPGQRR